MIACFTQMHLQALSVAWVSARCVIRHCFCVMRVTSLSHRGGIQLIYVIFLPCELIAGNHGEGRKCTICCTLLLSGIFCHELLVMNNTDLVTTGYFPPLQPSAVQYNI